MKFQVQVKLIVDTPVEVISILNWLKTTFGVKINSASGSYKQMSVNATILETTFNDAVTTIQLINTQYSSKLNDLVLAFTTD